MLNEQVQRSMRELARTNTLSLNDPEVGDVVVSKLAQGLYRVALFDEYGDLDLVRTVDLAEVERAVKEWHTQYEALGVL